jgi:ABC-2 type transport system ATP-binding protein
VTAVDGVSVEIDRGEVVGLLGHNGAGKTTLMKMLTGVLEPTAGTLSVGGSDLVEQRTEAQRHIGYLPESAPLYPEMEVFEYLLLMAELRGVERSQQDAAVIRAAEATGLMDRLGQPIRELSKGFRQRVGIAQAIVHDPDVLVLDEPTNGLDPVQIESIRSLITKLAERTTIILSTHILQEVEAVCDRVLVMIGGALSADAPLTDLLSSHTLRMSVKAGADVRKGLIDVDTITHVTQVGADPRLEGYEVWSLDHAIGAQPTPDVLEVASQKGWTVGAIAPEQRTLDGVFRELQQQHIAKQEAAA